MVKIKLYTGFTILGSALGGIYGITNYFPWLGIFWIVVIIGAVAGIALGLICNGVIESHKNKLYTGFTILGGALGGIHGITHFMLGGINFLVVIIIGAVAGIASGFVCNGVIESLKNKRH